MIVMSEASERLTRHPVIPVIVIDDENDAEPLAEALLAGGLDLIEVTLRTGAAMAALERIRRRFPEMLVGAGTVVTREQAERCLDLGVSFGVAPAVLGFTLGMRGVWDSLVLCIFVCCGVARLARYNVTSAALSGGTGKVPYYEGTPIPTSLVLVAVLAVACLEHEQGNILDQVEPD